MAQTRCPTRKTLAANRRGELQEADEAAVNAHLEAGCSHCAHVLGDLEKEDQAIMGLLRRCPPFPYEKGEQLGQGQGSMGVVYEAVCKKTGQHVAVKFLAPRLLASPDARERFLREAHACRSLDHPNICRMLDEGHTSDGPFLVSELANAGSLAEFVSDGKPWEPEVAAQFVKNLALAVHYAHEQGIVHRDLNPANILLHRLAIATCEAYSVEIPRVGAVTPKITDFGIAKWQGIDRTMTASGAFAGTLRFTAPEVFGDEGAKAANAVSDVYSLGAILYQLLTGHPPHEAEDIVSLTRKHLEGHSEVPPPRSLEPNVPENLDAVCSRALEPEPESRWASAKEFAEDLERFVNGKPTVAKPPGRLARFLNPRLSRFQDLRPGIIAGAVIGSTITLIFYWLQQVHVPHWFVWTLDGFACAVAVGLAAWAWPRLPKRREAREIYAIVASAVVAWFLIVPLAKICELTWAEKNVGWPFQCIVVAQGSVLLGRRLGPYFYVVSAFYVGLAFWTVLDRDNSPLWWAFVFGMTTAGAGFAVPGRRVIRRGKWVSTPT